VRVAAVSAAPSRTGVEPVTFDTVRRIALALPEVDEGTSYGTPSLRVRGKSFVRLWEDGDTIVLTINPYERAFLIEAEPAAFHVTDHYRDYPRVLARLSAVKPDQLRERIVESWRLTAPKRLVAAYDRG